MTDLEEALRSELRYRAETADREVSLLEPVARRVRRARRRCALAASTLTTIAATAITVAVPASSVLQPVVTTAAPTAERMAARIRHAGLQATINGPYAGPAGRVNGGIVLSHRTFHGDLPVGAGEPAGGLIRSASDPPLAQSVRLVYGPRTPAPAGWRWHRFGAIMLAAPASWAIKRDVTRRRCRPGDSPPTVVVGTATVRYVPGCSVWFEMYGMSESGVGGLGVVAGIRQFAAADTTSDTEPSLCQLLGGVRACVLWPDGALLKLAVFPPGAARPILVEIGPASSAATARAIFDSIRPVLGQRLVAPRWGRRAATSS